MPSLHFVLFLVEKSHKIKSLQALVVSIVGDPFSVSLFPFHPSIQTAHSVYS